MAEAYGNIVTHVNQWRRFRAWIKLEIIATASTYVTVKRTIAVGAAYADYTGYGIQSGDQSYTGITIYAGTSGSWVWSSSYSDTFYVARQSTARSYSVSAYAGLSGVSSYSTATATISIPALAGVTITFNANGGTGGPSTQSIPSGTATKLTTSTPTRSGYTFRYWSYNGSTYAPGASVTLSSNATFTAQWSATTVNPTISVFRCVRCDSSGSETPTGTCAKFTATAYVKSGSSYSSVSSVEVGWTDGTNSGTANLSSIGSHQYSVVVTSFTFDTEKTYAVVFAATANGKTVSATDMLTQAALCLDVSAGGVGVGCEAEAGKLKSAYPIVRTTDRGYTYLHNGGADAYTRWHCKNGLVYVEGWYWDTASVTTTEKSLSTAIETGYWPDRKVGQQCGTSAVWVDPSDGKVHYRGSESSSYLAYTIVYRIE